ncbi:MAG TPA: hypothetical protein VHY08_27595 [Bacillota bacterium]|nr:hypothetical protein [Bacillota bacterium]
MYARVEKPKEKKSRVDVNSVTQKKGDVKQDIRFLDNRKKTMHYQKMHEYI